ARESATCLRFFVWRRGWAFPRRPSQRALLITGRTSERIRMQRRTPWLRAQRCLAVIWRRKSSMKSCEPGDRLSEIERQPSANKMLAPHSVTAGITNGRVTEIVSGDLNAGVSIVIGEI